MLLPTHYSKRVSLPLHILLSWGVLSNRHTVFKNNFLSIIQGLCMSWNFVTIRVWKEMFWILFFCKQQISYAICQHFLYFTVLYTCTKPPASCLVFNWPWNKPSQQVSKRFHHGRHKCFASPTGIGQALSLLLAPFLATCSLCRRHSRWGIYVFFKNSFVEHIRHMVVA